MFIKSPSLPPMPFQVAQRCRTVKSGVSCIGCATARYFWRSTLSDKSNRVRSALQTPDLSEFLFGETILVHHDEMPSYLFCARQVGIAKWALG